MKNLIPNKTTEYRTEHRRKRRWHKVVTVLAAIVVFCTTYALILPAITWENQLICEVAEHTHTPSCYRDENGKQVLICGKTEHIHTAVCFDAPVAAAPEYNCALVEHTHTDDCYFEDGTLRCTLDEHEHTVDCHTEYEERALFACADGVEFTAIGSMPADAELKVQALSSRQTEQIGKTIEAAPGGNAYAYDIKIMSGGKELEPESGIRISMHGINVRNGEKVHGYHLPDIDAEDVDKINKETVKSEEVEIEVGSESFGFDAGGFSVFYFTVDFTVDFAYNGTMYSIDGHSDGITLSELMKELKMPKSVSDVIYVNWTGEATNYVTVSKTDGDWKITPNGEPFDVSGKLALSFKDGTTETVTVTDAISGNVTFKDGDTLTSDSLIGRHTISDNAVITIAGTVKVDSEISIGNNVTFKLSPDFPAGKIALQFTSSDAVLTEGGNVASLTIIGSEDKPFIIDGGARWSGTVNKTLGRGQTNIGISRDASLIQWGVRQKTDNLATTTHYGLNLNLTNVVLQNNASAEKHSGWSAQQGGGAIYLNNRTGEVNLTNVTIKDCYHISNGGAIMLYDNVGHHGIYGNTNVTVNMKNCEISGCDSGYDGSSTAGVIGGTIKTTGATQANLVLDNCYFHNNYSVKQGGAIVWYVASDSGQLTVKNSRFINNKAGSTGGAIDNRAVMTLEGNCLFQGNSATNGGAIYQSVYGGGAGADSQQQASSLNINSGTVIKENTASGNGGGVAFYGTEGTVARGIKLSVVMNGGQITNNTAANGGGIYFSKNANARYDTSIDLNDGLVSQNKASKSGGGIYVSRQSGDSYVGTVNISKGELSYNTAVNGGGIYSDQTNVDFGSTGEMVIKGNTATNGGGLYLNGISCTTDFEGNSHVIENEARNGGGGAIYVNNGAKLHVHGGIITNNVASGKDGDMKTTGAATAYNNQNTAKGVGGGVYIANGYFQLGDGSVQTEKEEVGIWGNVAYFAADDLYASGSGTTLNLPNINLMTLAEYYDPKDVQWVEDFYNEDTDYSTRWFGHTTNKGRYRCLDVETEGASVNMKYADLNTPNAYVCTTIGPVKWRVFYYNADGTQLLQGPIYYNHMQSMQIETYDGYFAWTTEPNGNGTLYHTGDKVQVKGVINLYATVSDVGSLRISETVRKAEGALTPPIGDEFEFTVTLPVGTYNYDIYSTGSGSLISSGTISSGGTITLKDGQYALIKGLPELQPYSVKPTSAENYEITGIGTSGKIQKSTTVAADFISTYVKMPMEAEFRVSLTDGSTPLSDSTFELYELRDGEWVLLDTITTDKNGIASYENITTESRYKLIQTDPPDGYIREGNEIYFELGKDKLVITDISGTPLEELPTYISDVSFSNNDGEIAATLSLVNRPGTILPATGGIVTPFLYTLGALLILCSVMFAYILRRKRERRNSV